MKRLSSSRSVPWTLPDVPFHPEVAEKGGDGAERQVMRAGRGVRRRGADVAAHEFRRDHQSGPALDGLPLQGVVAVRGPDPVGPVQDPEVHAGAAGGAAFNLDAGVGLLECVEQPVGGEGLFVDGGAAGVAVLESGRGSGPI